MKRVISVIVAATCAALLASSAAAAPKPTPPDGNHPAFPINCTGGPFPAGGASGVVVLANGGLPTLPTAFLTIEGSDETIVGVSMYREVFEIDTAPSPPTATLFREEARGNQTLEQVMARFDVARCSTILPGFALAALYPEADPPYDPTPTTFYDFVNYVK